MSKQHNSRLACWWGAGLAVLAATDAAATNGDQMLGVTATQWGMAGAVTAAPQDAGTVLTNPAGLAVLQLNEFRADMGFGFLNPPREANGVESDSDLYMLPSGALAFAVNDRVTFGMGMAGLSGMGVDVGDIAPAPGEQNVVTTKQFYKIAPGLSYRVNDRLALGAALNIDYQSLAMDLGATGMHLPQNQVFGFGASLGFVYTVSPRVRVGASYVSRQAMDEFKWNTSDGTFRMTMDAPPQYALGIAYESAPGLLFAADVKHIGFSEVLDDVDLKLPNGATQTLAFGWDDQIVYALAVQKRVNPKTVLRLGYNYGASPIDEEDVNSNVGSLAVTEHHISLGLTRELTPKVATSISYVHAFANELEASNGTTIELEQNVVNLQISYRN